VKYYGRQEGLLDLPTHDDHPDFYLVLAGPTSPPGASKDGLRPFVIDAVFLFESVTLVPALRKRGVRLGTATSVASSFWKEAMLFPEARSSLLSLSPEQFSLLSNFRQLG